jgi:UDPglucose 6-dehydrogenase
LNAGIGFGGPCLPKDVLALHKQWLKTGGTLNDSLLHTVIKINQTQREWATRVLEPWMNEQPDSTIAIWGITFKGGTADVTDSPALDILYDFISRGWHVRIHDPAYDTEKRILELQDKYRWTAGLYWCSTKEEAINGADVLVVLSDWDEYKEANLHHLGHLFRKKRIVDGRNLFPPNELEQLGYEFIRVGYGRN